MFPRTRVTLVADAGHLWARVFILGFDRPSTERLRAVRSEGKQGSSHMSGAACDTENGFYRMTPWRANSIGSDLAASAMHFCASPRPDNCLASDSNGGMGVKLETSLLLMDVSPISPQCLRGWPSLRRDGHLPVRSRPTILALMLRARALLSTSLNLQRD